MQRTPSLLVISTCLPLGKKPRNQHCWFQEKLSLVNTKHVGRNANWRSDPPKTHLRNAEWGSNPTPPKLTWEMQIGALTPQNTPEKCKFGLWPPPKNTWETQRWGSVPKECAWIAQKNQGYEEKSELVLNYKAQQVLWQDSLYSERPTKAQQGKQTTQPNKIQATKAEMNWNYLGGCVWVCVCVECKQGWKGMQPKA